jgi:Subtilase family
LLGGPGTPFDETAERNIVPFTDPGTGEVYDIIDGRITVAFKNPPPLPFLDPDYFDIERADTDMAYATPMPNPTLDPAIAAFIAAEGLDVVNTWDWVKSIGALLPPGQSVLDAVTNWPLLYPDIILAVTPDYIVPTATGEPSMPPIDDGWALTWSLRDDNPFNIHIHEAWGEESDQDSDDYKYNENLKDVEVAIFDTGVDYDNGSQQNTDLVRNSDVYGCNVGDEKGATTFWQRVDEGGEPWDWLLNWNAACASELGHGTSVAGVISAHIDNDYNPNTAFKNVTGIAYNPKYFPIAVKAFYKEIGGKYVGGFSSWAIYHGYTALGCMKGCLNKTQIYGPGVFVPSRPGIEVVNLSLGSQIIETKPPMEPMFAFISYYMCCVCATGNENSAVQNSFPARHPNAFSVAGYTSLGARWGGSNYAPDTDIAAPTPGIYTTEMVGTNIHQHRLGRSPNAFRDDFSGTSAAAPHVAAIALLVSAKYDYLRPALVQAQVKDTQTDSPPLTGFLGRITRHPSAINALSWPE